MASLSQGAFTCLCCMEALSTPVGVAGCNHVVNQACVDREGGRGAEARRCPECKGEVGALVPLPALEELASKHSFRLQALEGLEQTAQALRAGNRAE